MIDWILRRIITRVWRWRTKRDAKMIDDHSALRPGKCLYCDYTRWANEEHGQHLTIEPHGCIEGNGGPESIPEARVVKGAP